ncbi:MAG TPA: hypothetical protein VH044_18785 [Polyangiaceae bacterium]|jgi:hypothetical protein|nr:hypothetical protein [Polyangiaceae bacterium]
MAPFGIRYPVVFQAVMNHAQRLRSFLEEREARLRPGDPGEAWLIGRAGEVQCVLAIVALDWHQQRVSGDEAATRLARYVREIHDGMAMHLDIGMPHCCRAPLHRAKPREAVDDRASERSPPVQQPLPGR